MLVLLKNQGESTFLGDSAKIPPKMYAPRPCFLLLPRLVFGYIYRVHWRQTEGNTPFVLTSDIEADGNEAGARIQDKDANRGREKTMTRRFHS